MFSTINQFCHTYYDQIPADGLRAAGLSATLSFVTSVFIITLRPPVNQSPPSLARAGLAAGIALTAAIIHTLTTPIFNYIFDNQNNEFNGFQEFVRIFVDLTFAHILINHATPYNVNLLTPTDLKNERFGILPHTTIKIYLDMAIRLIGFIDPSFAHSLRIGSNQWGANLNQNTSPIYLTA